MGLQEVVDWEFTIQNINDRIQALENQNRSQGPRTSDIQGAMSQA